MNSNDQRKDLLLQALQKIEELQAAVKNKEYTIDNEPIAVIGMGCRFPGGANQPDTFWKNLCAGVDAVIEVPKDRWNMDDYYDSDPDAVGKIYTRQGGFLHESVDQFDARFFGISPREAAALDPQQRLALEVSWEALENSGIAPTRLRGSQTGVFMGIGSGDYAHLHSRHANANDIDTYTGSGGGNCFAAGRISFCLGLQGPSLIVDTACSSSLVSVHLAMQSLRQNECRLALAGGVHLILSPDISVYLSRIRALAADGKCKAFDAQADGFVRGEGCGIVVLKRLSDAQRDGDTVYAVLRGSAVNQDGPSSGLTVPNGPAQQAVVREALENAQIKAEEMTYIESHGTGTALGDPIEMNALAAALGRGRKEDNPFYVGSVKTGIGHLEAAAGIAGLIKTVLALHYKQLPPNLNFRKLSPHITVQERAIRILTELTPWQPACGKRYAGVSSFGLSGTNAHIVLEEAPEPSLPRNEPDRPYHILRFSGKCDKAIRKMAEDYARYFEQTENVELSDGCFSANTGRAEFAHRAAFFGTSKRDMAEALRSYLRGDENAPVFAGRKETKPTSIAFLFSGQGAQYPGMGWQLFETQPVFRQWMERCDRILRDTLNRSLLELLYSNGPDMERLHETMYAQPALLAMEYSLYKLWLSWGVKPTVVLGHSLGEYSAACAAGIMCLEDALRIAALRGRLMQSLPQDGDMAAVFADEKTVQEAIRSDRDWISIAACNGPENVVISGERRRLQAIVDLLEKRGIRSKRLMVSHAFHSPLMQPILDEFQALIGTVRFQTPKIPIVTNLWGTCITGNELSTPEYWVKHLMSPVRFRDSVVGASETGCRVFLEIGPHTTLSGMATACLEGRDAVFLPSLRRNQDDWPVIATSLGRLYAKGIDVDWKEFDQGYMRKRVMVPTYSFQRERHWSAVLDRARKEKNATSVYARTKNTGAPNAHPLLGYKVRSASKEIIYENDIHLERFNYLRDHQFYQTPVYPAAAYLEMMAVAGRKYFGNDAFTIQNISIQEKCTLGEDSERTLQTIVTPYSDQSAQIEIHSLQTESDSIRDVWTHHISGHLQQSDVSLAKNQPKSLNILQKRITEEHSPENYYAQLQSQGVTYGPSFQAIQKIYSQEGEALAHLSLPEELQKSAKDYAIHPALLDAAFQSVGKAISNPDANGGGLLSYMPIGLESCTLYTRQLTQAWVHVAVKKEIESNSTTIDADFCLYDLNGNPAAVLEGLKLVPAKNTTHPSSKTAAERWLYEIQWQPVENKKQNRFSFDGENSPRHWIAFVEADDWGISLASQIYKRGDIPIVAYRGSRLEKITHGQWIVPAENPEAMQQFLAAVFNSSRNPWDGILYLWDEKPECNRDTFRSSDLHTSESLCLGLLHLVQALAAGQEWPPTKIWIGTRGAQSIEKESNSCLKQSPLWGLGRTLAEEHPELWGGIIDFSLDREKEINDFFSLIQNKDSEDQIALRQDRIFAPRLTPIHLKKNEAPLLLRRDGTYLVTGGMGGLGLCTAQWLAERGAGCIALMGRSEPSGEALAALDRLREQGVVVIVCRANVADIEQVRVALEWIPQDRYPLRGVIHAAGVLDDGVLLQQDRGRYQRVFAPKANGAWNLHELTQDLTLDFFVLYSSAASVLGSTGQSNYAAANAFLDGLAQYRQFRGLPALCVNWGAWTEVGMAARLLKQDRSRMDLPGARAITTEQGMHILESLLQMQTLGDSACPTQVCVLPFQWTELLKSYPRMRSKSILKNILPLSESKSENHSLFNCTEFESMANEAKLAYLQTYIRHRIAKLLNDSPDSLELHQPITGFGFDSMMAIELKNRIEKDTHAVLSLSALLAGRSIDELAVILHKELEKSVSSLENALIISNWNLVHSSKKELAYSSSGATTWEEGVL